MCYKAYFDAELCIAVRKSSITKPTLLQKCELEEKSVVTQCGLLIIRLKKGLSREAAVKAALSTTGVH